MGCACGREHDFLVFGNQLWPFPVDTIVNKRVYVWLSVLGVILLALLGHKAWLAHQNLVSLDVRNADVRDVVRKCEWQTWETIVVHKDVKGKVTYTCHNQPLEDVLDVIAEQTSSRATAVYPIYSKSQSFVNLRKLARGDIYRDTAGWTNFDMVGNGGGRGGRGGPGFGGFGGFGDTVRSQHALVSLNLPAKDLSFAALALARFSNAQVVPEDGASGLITLRLNQVPFTEAVSKVAKAAGRKWDVFYSLQAQPDFFAGRGDGPPDEGGGRRGFGRFRGDGGETNQFNTNRWAELREQRDATREIEREARLATMTPEEQAKANEEQKKLEEIRNLPPDEQRQRFEEMMANNANQQRGEARFNSRFKNATPEQRVDQASRRSAMRNRRAQQQQSNR